MVGTFFLDIEILFSVSNHTFVEIIHIHYRKLFFYFLEIPDGYLDVFFLSCLIFPIVEQVTSAHVAVCLVAFFFPVNLPVMLANIFLLSQ